MEYVIFDISAWQYWNTPPEVAAMDLSVSHELSHVGLPDWMFRHRSNSREIDRIVQKHLFGQLKGLELPIHVMVPEGCSKHDSSLVVPHRTPSWLRREHVISIGSGLSVVTPELSLLLRRNPASKWDIALDMLSACGIYAIHKPTRLSALAMRIMREKGFLSPRIDPNLVVYGFSDENGKPLGPISPYGTEYPWTPSFNARGMQTDLWKRPPLTSSEMLRLVAAELVGARDTKLARSTLEVMRDGSASPVESRAYLLLCAGRTHGGEAFGVPDLNRRITFDAKARALAHQSSCFGDMVWIDRKRVLEVQGYGFHTDEQGFYVQTGRAPALQAMGYRMSEITYAQMADLEVFDALLTMLAEDLGFPLARRTPKFIARRDELHRALFK